MNSHLAHDAERNRERAAATIARKRRERVAATGQLPLLGETP